jgi:putative endonuclease
VGRDLSSYKKGINAEMIVATYLMRHGYGIIKHRYKTQFGEIDIIARKEKLILFIEVKNRKSTSDREIISNHQKKRCCDAAAHFLASHQQFLSFAMRFDCFFIDRYGKLEHIENAWDITVL